MLNVTTALKGSKLTLTIDLSKEQGTSKSGLSTLIASSQGNQPVGDALGTKIGVNVYRPIPR
jgi:hypothetical protein